MKSPLVLYDRYALRIHILNPHERPAFNGEDHLIDLLLGPLDLHHDRAVVFVAHPAGTAVQLSGVTRTVAESHALYGADENDVLADHRATTSDLATSTASPPMVIRPFPVSSQKSVPPRFDA